MINKNKFVFICKNANVMCSKKKSASVTYRHCHLWTLALKWVQSIKI